MRFLTLKEYEERKAKKEKRREAARAKRYTVDTFTLTSSSLLLICCGFLAGMGLAVAAYLISAL